jgi:hypothetical protein
MTELLYLAVGMVVGVVICPVLNYAKSRYLAWRKNKPQIVDESATITCGACKSIIFSPPMNVIVSEKTSFKVYRCQQCATKVTVPL